MSFVAPLFVAAAGVAALATVLLHLLAVRRPRPLLLPTARFAPDTSVRAASFARRPTNLVLLALRVLALLLVGAAFARPVFVPDRAALRRVILVDRSAAVGSDASIRDSVASIARPGDLVVPFADSVLAWVPVTRPDSLELPPLRPRLGSLTTALVAGRRAATALRDSAEQVELVLVSPLVAEEADAATLAVRAQWAGTLHVVRVPAAQPAAGDAHPVVVESPDEDDPVAAGVALAGAVAPAPVRIVRGETDSGSSTADSSGAVVLWPRSGAPAGWERRPAPDTIGALTADASRAGAGPHGASTLVAPFVRVARPPAPTADVRPIAWWADGEVAAIERRSGAGCVREVGVPLPEGDLTLRPPFARLLTALIAPCGDVPASFTPIPDSALAPVVGAGPAAVPLARAGLAADARSPLVPWLLGGALLLLLLEWLVRRRERGAAEEVDS